MKKILMLLLAATFIIASTASCFASDNFLGVPFDATYDTIQGFVKGAYGDGKYDVETEKEILEAPSFHRGTENIGNVKVGSVFFVYDQDTKKLTDIYCVIEFTKGTTSPKIVKRNNGIHKDPYYSVEYPYSDAERIYKELLDYFTQNYGEPSSTDGTYTTWFLFDQNMSLSLAWNKNDARGTAQTIDIIFTASELPPDAAIFL